MTMTDTARALYTAEQVRRIDRAAIDACGIPGYELMSRAAAAAFAALRRHWPHATRITLLAGTGNNGGDAWLLGRAARAQSLDVTAIALADPSTPDAAKARDAFRAAGGRVVQANADMSLDDADVYVDGLFGTGLARPIEGVAARLVEALAGRAPRVLALDLPSGLDADRGVAGRLCVQAAVTVSFVGWKRGLFTGDGADACGCRELATLDLPAEAYRGIEPDAFLLGNDLDALLPPRRSNVHKLSFGHVLAIGGEHGFGGAVRLCGEAAMRCGAGLVSVATRAMHVAGVTALRPELIAHAVEDAVALDPLLARASVIALGPGLGVGEWGRALAGRAIASAKPLVIDADALNLLAQTPRALPRTSVLTPHPGEAARLLGCDTRAVQGDRYAAVRELARRFDAVVVLKGAGSLIADPQGRVDVCPWGNPGMATAGTGDVLTGVIAALLAQGLAPWDAARLGVAWHARAGDVAAGAAPRGLLARDLMRPLRAIANGVAT